MKKYFITLTVLAVSTILFGQTDPKILEGLKDNLNTQPTETSVKVKKETRKAQTIYVFGPKKDLEKSYTNYFQSKYACEIKKVKGSLVASNIKMSDVTNETVNLIANIEEDENGSKLDVMVDLGTTFLSASENPDEVAKLKVVISNFVSEFYVGWYDKVIEVERKDYEKSVKENEKMVKEGDKMIKEFESKTEKITKSQDDIVKSEKEIADLQIKIAELKLNIENLESEKSQLGDKMLENDKKKQESKNKVDKKSADLGKLKTNADRLRTKQ